MIVYKDATAKAAMIALEAGLRGCTRYEDEALDITIASKDEFAKLRLDQDNLTRAFP